MKKKVRITTTDFYKNPSKALNVVKEGGVVYLAYKNLKDPIAVIRDYESDEKLKSGKMNLKDKRITVLKRIWKQNKGKKSKWKSGMDLQNAVRQ